MVTYDMRPETHEKWHVKMGGRGVEQSLKFQLPSSYGLGVKIFWRIRESMN